MDLPVAQLSCQNCKLRKRKCDKLLPSCSACKKAGDTCSTVQRQRLPRGRTARLAKSSSEQVLRDRVDHLEAIVARLQHAQPTIRPNDHHDQNQNQSDCASTPSESFVAPDFWAELMESVAGLRSVLEDTDSSDHTNDVQSPWLLSEQPESLDPIPHDKSGEPISCGPNQMLFGSSGKNNSTNTPPEMDHFLLDVYHKRVHALFPVLHWPSTLALLEAANDPQNTNLRALRSAVHFSSVCSLMDFELEARRNLLDQYRQRAEQAFIDAELLTTTSLIVLQAFVIYLAGLRACEANAQQWTLVPLALRLASALNLGTSSSSQGLSAFDKEIRCRLWCGIGVLDLQCAFDRGSRAILSSRDLAEWPLNIDDLDISTANATGLAPQDRFTEMSFCLLTCRAGVCHRKLTELGLSAADGTEDPHRARAQQVATLVDFEASVLHLQGQCDATPTNIQAFAVTVAQESLVAMRLLFYRPLHKRGKGHEAFDKDQLGKDELLTMATEVLERSQSKRSWAQFAQWAWFKWVKWYALAVVLAELCTAHGTRADHAWIVAQRSYSDYANIVADTKSGLLWKPIARLMQRVNALRMARTEKSYHAVPLPMDAEPIDMQWNNDVLNNISPTSSSNMEPRSEEHTFTLPDQANISDKIHIDNDADVDMSWLYWDLLIEDIETEGLHLDS